MSEGEVRERRFVFGEVADLYDEARPGYPSPVFDDLETLTALNEHSHILEVGAGTGKATEALAARGASVDAIEPSESMAAVARNRLSTWPSVDIHVSTFEDWDASPATYDLIVAAQSWHWVPEPTGFDRAAEMLRGGGWLTLLWNHPRDRGAFADEVDEVYSRLLPETGMASQWSGSQRTKTARDWAGEIDASGLFGRVVSREYPWTQVYTTDSYLRLMRTHSDHRLLDPQRRSQLLEEVGAVIDRNGGTIDVGYVCRLYAAELPSDGSRATASR
jgi:SAM-dependent methyltransferase